MKKLQAFVLVLLFSFISCGKSYKAGECENEEYVKFRNLIFKFPLRANKINQFGENHVEHGYRSAITDSLVTGTSVIWYYDINRRSKNNLKEENLLIDSLNVYGVTFNLYADSDKNDQEIIQELKQNYPGNFVFHDTFDAPHYDYSRGCLKIIMGRKSYSFSSKQARQFSTRRSVSAPTVSFCYGLTDKQVENYIRNSGNIYSAD